MGAELDGGVTEIDHAAEAWVAGEGEDAGGGVLIPGEAAFAQGRVLAADAEGRLVEVEVAVRLGRLRLGGQGGPVGRLGEPGLADAGTEAVRRLRA